MKKVSAIAVSVLVLAGALISVPQASAAPIVCKPTTAKAHAPMKTNPPQKASTDSFIANGCAIKAMPQMSSSINRSLVLPLLGLNSTLAMGTSTVLQRPSSAESGNLAAFHLNFRPCHWVNQSCAQQQCCFVICWQWKLKNSFVLIL